MEQAKIPERYKLIAEVGQGGMAVVYRAHDETLKREVAIKVLHQHLAAEPESKARLEREAQAVAKLHHDNILEIFDYSGLDSPERVHRHRVHRRPDAEAVPGHAHAAPPGGRGDDRPRGVRRAGARARGRRPPPRRQAGERDGPQGRPAQADGLRHRAGAGPGANDRDRPAARLAGVHGARDRRGQAARLPHRRLLRRHHDVPARDRQPARSRARTRTRCCGGSPRASSPTRGQWAGASIRRCRASSPARSRGGPTIATPTSGLLADRAAAPTCATRG